LKTEEDESAPRTSNGADKGKKKRKRKAHAHIGPNARAFRAGLAFCPSCDADKALRLTEKEREASKAVRPERHQGIS
jgi:hypothetical protein